MSEFGKDPGRRDGLHRCCRACCSILGRLSRARHRDTRREYKRRIRLRNKQRVLKYLRRHPCLRCGEPDPVVLEFHHTGKKKATIASLIKSETSWKVIAREMGRCKVLCANDHRRETARERGWFRARPEAGDMHV